MTTASTPTLPFCRVPLLPLEHASIRWALIGTYIFQFLCLAAFLTSLAEGVTHVLKAEGWTNKVNWFTSKSRQLKPIVASEICWPPAVVGGTR
jgi:hypothetical protein